MPSFSTDIFYKKIPKSPKFLNCLNFRHLGVFAFRHLLYGVFKGAPLNILFIFTPDALVDRISDEGDESVFKPENTGIEFEELLGIIRNRQMVDLAEVFGLEEEVLFERGLVVS